MRKPHAIILAALVMLSSVFCVQASAQSTAEAAPSASVSTQTQNDGSRDLKKMRGQLLSKRNKIRRLEKAAMQSDEQLRDKVESLQKQRQALFCGANSELTALYAEEQSMQKEIDTLSANKK